MNKDRAVQITYFLLRVVAGLMFMQAGGTKILGWLGGMPPEAGGPPAMWTQIWIGGMLELIGGAMILAGLLTRPVAFILAGEMAVAYWQFHYKAESFWPSQNGGVAAVLYCFVFLFTMAYGGGEWSLDAVIGRKRKAGSGAG